jgi:hypothetical protein
VELTDLAVVRRGPLGLAIATQPGQTRNDPAEILDYLGPARTHYL